MGTRSQRYIERKVIKNLDLLFFWLFSANVSNLVKLPCWDTHLGQRGVEIRPGVSLDRNRDKKGLDGPLQARMPASETEIEVT